MKRHLAVLEQLGGQSGTGDTAEFQTYAENFQKEYEELIPVAYCEDLVLNSVLTNKADQCKKAGIQLQIDLQGYQSGTVHKGDLVMLLTILFEYGIARCQEQGRHQLWLRGTTVAGALLLKLTDAGKPGAPGAKILERKNSSEELEQKKSSLNALLKNYQGRWEVQEQEDTFEFIVQLSG